MRGDTYGNIVNVGSGNIGTGATQVGASEHTSPVSRVRQGDAAPADRTRNVIVVSGRDEQVRVAMFAFLRELGLRPLDWFGVIQAAGDRSPSIQQAVAQVPALAQAALILLTPDDLVTLHPELRAMSGPEHDLHTSLQPHPNALIELGMLLMAYAERAVVVQFGVLRPIADLSGRNVIRFDGSVSSLGKIASRLMEAGCAVDDTGADWRDTRRFEHLAALKRGI